MEKRKIARSIALGLVLGLALGAGRIDGARAAPLPFGAQITFGDSLSDVGSYTVGAVAAGGGGKFTVNGNAFARHPELTGQVWPEMVAALAGLPPPCAAQTGLLGDPDLGLFAPVLNHPGCFDYAQGGARIVDPIGPGNVAAGSPIGELTVPVAGQVASHLAAAGGRFQGNELVLVMAGANDVVTQWRQLVKGANDAVRAAGTTGTAADDARIAYWSANRPAALAAMSSAGNQLAAIVQQQIVGLGANFVVVNNVPDLSGTPLGGIQAPPLRALVQAMVQSFNAALKAGLDPLPQVVQVDVFALSQDELANPAAYGLTNTTAPACGPNALDGNSLACNVFNVYPNVDISHFLFADTVHPTPYGHWLIATRVAAAMAGRGWL
ncbi:SGNH/GDSL hydrolase family protein [Massilia sp. 9096]|uniref:SGNH/GDSL hydrolase family protein n=1 Tax=Massilia sp. 9096 TaxID=1500894 RepID=UPI000559E286|nr:SGNH/GDSL hydrolase family protein [Massilia sp. 9096]